MTAKPSPGMFVPPVAPPRKSFARSAFGWILFIVLAVMVFVIAQGKKQRDVATIPLSQFDAMLRDDAIVEVTVEDDSLYGTARPGKELEGNGGRTSAFRTVLPVGMSDNWNFMQYLLENRGSARVAVDRTQSLLLQVLVPLIPWLLIFLFVWFFVFRHLRKSAGVAREPMPVVVVNQPPQNT